MSRAQQSRCLRALVAAAPRRRVAASLVPPIARAGSVASASSARPRPSGSAAIPSSTIMHPTRSMQSSRTWFRRLTGASTALALLACALPTSAQPAPAPSPAPGGITPIQSPSERADELHREAKALLEEENWEQALPKLREAYSIKPSYDIVTNLGWTLTAMEQHVEAAHRMCEALDKLPTDVDRTRFDNVYHDARSRVGAARILSAEAEVAILVDDRPASVCTHDQAKIVFVEPGQHAFVAERDGRRSEPVAPTFTAGKEVLVRLGALQEGAVAPPNGDDGPSGMLVGGAVLAALGGAALIGGGIMYGVSGGIESDHAALGSAARAEGIDCSPVSVATEARCAELADKGRQYQQLANASVPTMIAGAGLLVLGGILVGVAVASDDDEPPQTTSLDVWVGDGAGAVFRFAW